MKIFAHKIHIKWCLFAGFISLGTNITFGQSATGKSEVSIQIDGAKRFQTMDGFGVNINAAWWYNGKYTDAKVVQPAIDLLVDSLGAALFRVVIEEIDWEEVNDDNDPGHFNWTYYNKIFSETRFKGVWNTLRYLNQKGITDGLLISFMGAAPSAPPLAKPDPKRSWMGGIEYSIKESMEDELVETQAALLYYMRNTQKIKFGKVSPINETDIVAGTISTDHPQGLVEGPNISDAVQYVRVVKKLAQKLDKIGMSDVRFVAPDAAADKLFFAVVDEMVKDLYLMNKLVRWGVHQYGNDAQNYLNKIKTSPIPDKPYWVTETARISHLMGQLDDNASAFFFWDGFDCVYQHGRRNGYGSVAPNDWVFWFSNEGKPLIEFIPLTSRWQPRKQFYEFAQVMKFVKPGAIRMEITGQDSSLAVYAFCNPNGNMAIVGRNNSKQSVIVNGSFSNLPDLKNLNMIYTDSVVNLKVGEKIRFSGNNFKITVPAESVFTITGELSSLLRTEIPEPTDRYTGDIFCGVCFNRQETAWVK